MKYLLTLLMISFVILGLTEITQAKDSVKKGYVKKDQVVSVRLRKCLLCPHKSVKITVTRTACGCCVKREIVCTPKQCCRKVCKPSCKKRHLRLRRYS